MHNDWKHTVSLIVLKINGLNTWVVAWITLGGPKRFTQSSKNVWWTDEVVDLRRHQLEKHLLFDFVMIDNILQEWTVQSP